VRPFRALFHLLLFFAAFSVNTKVRAAQHVRLPKAKEILQLPAGCLEAKSSGCAVSSRAGERALLAFGDSKLTLGSQTTILIDDQSQVRLVKGILRIEAGSELAVRSEYGEARIAKGEFWVVKTSDRVTVSSIDGDVELRPRGLKGSLWVTPGLENYMGRVGGDGVAGTGVPVPLNSRLHIRRWARLHDGSSAEFKEQVLAFQDKWHEASRQAAAIHNELLVRKVASLEAEHVARESQRRKVEARNRELVEMFRRRVLGEF
jgi:hypothetical protein